MIQKEKEDPSKHPLFEYEILDLIDKSNQNFLIFILYLKCILEGLSVYRYAKSKKSTITLAIKIIEKSKIIKEGFDTLYKEYQLAKSCNHPFIVIASFIEFYLIIG